MYNCQLHDDMIMSAVMIGNWSILLKCKQYSKMHVNKEFEKNLTVLMQMLHLQHVLAIAINVTGEPVQDPQAYISWIISYCQYISLIK